MRDSLERPADDRYSHKLVAPADFDGPIRGRRCTDVLCLLLLFICWIAMTGVGFYSITNGDYEVVLFPMDYRGNICGKFHGDRDMTEFPLLLYVNSFTGGVCVKDCPQLEGRVSDNLTDVYSLITYNGSFRIDEKAELPLDFVNVADYNNSELSCNPQELCFPDIENPSSSWTSFGIQQGLGFAYYVTDTVEFFWRCYVSADASIRLKERLNETDATLSPALPTISFWNDLYADFWTAKEYILGIGFGGSLLLSFVYMMLLRIPFLLRFMVWASIFLTIALFFGAGYYTYNVAVEWRDDPDNPQDDRTINVTFGAAYTLWVLGVLLILLTCCLRKQIQLAVSCVKQAGRAINSMIFIIIIPILQCIAFVIFISVFIVYAVYLASLGDIQIRTFALDTDIDLDFTETTTQISYRVFVLDEFVTQCAWYLLFCFFWTSGFLIAVGNLMIAMSVAKWYFIRNKHFINNCTVVGSIKDTLLYHLGTCAYGSLIIAIVQIIRAILARIQKTVAKANNKCANVILCCCQCCFWCLENCLKFIHKNAYIQTAIFGTSFCYSAREAFGLILRNIGRIGAITYVSAAVLIVGKLFISAATTAVGYVAMTQSGIHEELYSIYGPMVLIFLIAYIVSDMFMDIFDMGILTILHCFVADEEMFARDECYAEGDLRNWIDRF